MLLAVDLTKRGLGLVDIARRTIQQTRIETQCRKDMSCLSPRDRGSIDSRIATRSDFRRVRRWDFRNGQVTRIRYHIFDTRPDTEFNKTLDDVASELCQARP